MSEPLPGRRSLNTAADVIDEFLNRVPHVGEAGLERKRLLLEFAAAKGGIAVSDLIADDLEKWIEEHPGWESDWTKLRVARSIKRPFNWCWAKGLINHTPFRGVSYRPGPRGEALSEEQFRMLLRNSSPEFRRVLLFLWWTGARPCELSVLEWSFINAEAGSAVLREHKTARSRKDREPRLICLPARAVRLLIWILRNQRDDVKQVFLNSRHQPWDRRSLDTRFWRLRARLGLPATAKLYGCRHSYASRLSMAGVELKTLSVLMGHTTTAMCERYIHQHGQTAHLLNALEKGLAAGGDQARKK